MNSCNAVEARQLREAFQVFNLSASELCIAYEELSRQVEALTRELALANGELRRQIAEKEALSRRLELLLQALPGGMLVLDRLGVVAEANSGAVAMLGAPLVGCAWEKIAAQRLAPTGVPGEWRHRFQARGERPLRISIAGRMLDNAEGKVLLIQDITAAHALHELAQRNRRLSVMGEMAARLAHQLRTPLAAALLYGTQLGDACLPAVERARFAQRTVERLRHMECLISDMLLFVTGGAGAREEIDVPRLLKEACRAIEPQVRERGLQLEIADASAGSRLRGNGKALLGALLGLLENALQACSGGGRIRLAAAVETGGVVLSVSDTGAGIATELQGRLFEPFFTTRSDGTGLGLAIVRSVAEAHGGTVAVRSVPGAGSEFRMRLPMEPEEANADPVIAGVHDEIPAHTDC